MGFQVIHSILPNKEKVIIEESRKINISNPKRWGAEIVALGRSEKIPEDQHSESKVLGRLAMDLKRKKTLDLLIM